jgi:hypothetical protein
MAAAGRQLHNLGSFPITSSQVAWKKGRYVSQRVLKERTHAERVLTKAEPNPTSTTPPSAAPTVNPTTTFPDLEIEYPDSDVG